LRAAAVITFMSGVRIIRRSLELGAV